ncbi:hypothetical protein EZV62_021075 [Acer yangbiense]|uniref:Uncharacterized protein n=1 Tax=Acer yangbiense TaxID=1000413 RepID=A0A5C7H6R6_9ROSI|nr:hypothetical protein EZV62_021075 [Acer yangbiense]
MDLIADKALTEHCKKHGVDVKSTALIELPVGTSFSTLNQRLRNSHGFYSLDDSIPFGSSSPFKVSLDSNLKEKFRTKTRIRDVLGNSCGG